MIPATTERVPLHTDPQINEAIRRQTERNIACVAAAGPAAIQRRLAELDREWDIERVLETNAATASLVGLTLGLTVDRRLLVLPVLVGGFLLQHAIQGWCPPVPLFRRWGFRTEREIDEERFALKAIRGDFQNLPSSGGTRVDLARFEEEGGSVADAEDDAGIEPVDVAEVLQAVRG